MAANLRLPPRAVPYLKLLVSILAGAAVLLIPRPAELDPRAWRLLAIFIGVVCAFLLNPFPMGVTALTALVAAFLTGSVSLADELSGFGNPTVWLVAGAFFISRGFIKSGLGARVAYLFIKTFGKSSLGLSYAILGCDFLLAPVTPSNTARAGGALLPMVRSLAEAFDSRPDDASRGKIASFLIYTLFQGNIVTSTMFFTAVASTPMAAALAATMGIHIGWGRYFLAALGPGVFSLVTVPLIIYALYPPLVKHTPAARVFAEQALKALGPVSFKEKMMMGCFVVLLLLWTLGPLLHISATGAALIGLVLLLLTGTLTWGDVIGEKGAWNTFIWYAVIIMLAGQLNKLGLIAHVSAGVAGKVAFMPWQWALTLLAVFYFYIHYLCPAGAAQVGALYAPVLAIAVGAGAPPVLAALVFMYCSSIMASTAHYVGGPAPIIFGTGAVSQRRWWGLNAIFGVFYLAVWVGGGSLWAKLIGIY